jgi:hypothetical protein
MSPSVLHILVTVTVVGTCAQPNISLLGFPDASRDELPPMSSSWRSATNQPGWPLGRC